ncbi:hypothetical protein [Guptibacillus algicola]|uniref:hypothetical protein n=1 Tax=Guptibacillus algicola TaxID=225844 RepID=UPI001CD2A92B|nr:hypothetical protein [Alkalihalobacillus algicola]MCA0987063.1 hypothetical protein [Alkalihalobacillus algicola]
MSNQSNQIKWDEIEQFVKTVESEKQNQGSVKPYIEEIKSILLKSYQSTTQ